MSKYQFVYPPRTMKEPCQTCDREHLRAYGNLEIGLAPCGLPECEWDEDQCIHINRIVQDHWMSPLEGQDGLFLIGECYCPDCKATFQAVSDGRIIEGTLKRPDSIIKHSKRTDVVELIKEARNAEADKDLEIVTNGKPLTYCNPLHRPALDAQKLRLNLQIKSSQEKHSSRRRTE